MPVTEQFLSRIAAIQSAVQQDLDNLDIPVTPRYLYDPVRYVTAGRGKRLRPVLVRLAGEACAAAEADLVNAGLAVELLHNFTLVHDDIMDGDDLRHDQPTVYKRWDDSTAILAGDGIFAISQLKISQVKSNPELCFRRFNEATLAICEGQALDKEFESRTAVTLDEYLDMIARKTGNLLGLCAELGAILGNQPVDVHKSLFDYGILLGQAFQVQDDILEITADAENMGKSLGSDIAAGKQTVLTILARERNIAEWERFRKEHEAVPVAELRERYNHYFIVSGVLAQARQMASDLVSRALEKLQVIPEAGRADLLAFSDLVLNRKK